MTFPLYLDASPVLLVKHTLLLKSFTFFSQKTLMEIKKGAHSHLYFHPLDPPITQVETSMLILSERFLYFRPGGALHVDVYFSYKYSGSKETPDADTDAEIQEDATSKEG